MGGSALCVGLSSARYRVLLQFSKAPDHWRRDGLCCLPEWLGDPDIEHHCSVRARLRLGDRDAAEGRQIRYEIAEPDTCDVGCCS